MKRILIIGDSWGIEPTTIYKNPHLDSKHLPKKDIAIFDWLDYKLMSLGHGVNNRSFGGCNNYALLTLVETTLDAAKHQNFNIDLVVWFHGELCKEIWWSKQNFENPNYYLKIIKNNGLETGLDELAKSTYSYAREIAEAHPNTKWAIIGAGAAIRNSQVRLLDFADFIIENLRNEITGIVTPECHTYYCIKDNNIIDELVEKQIFTEQEKEIESKKWLEIDQLQSDTKFFYNTKHPSPLAYKNLTNILINHFEL